MRWLIPAIAAVCIITAAVFGEFQHVVSKVAFFNPTANGRERVQAVSATFYRFGEGKEVGYEVEIAVDAGNAFTMPVFFRSGDKLVKLSDDRAEMLIDKWLKGRAVSIASMGIVDTNVSTTTPYMTINVNDPTEP